MFSASVTTRDISHPHILFSCPLPNWKCDGCGFIGKNTNTMRFRCNEGCDYDLCKTCKSKAKIKVNENDKVFLQEHCHLLQLERSGTLWACDKCKQHGRDNLRYRCLQNCDFDICLSCISNGFVATDEKFTRNLHHHPLRKCKMIGAWVCDICRKCKSRDAVSTETRNRCNRGCDFDVCQECMVKEESESNDNANDLNHGEFWELSAHPHPLRNTPMNSPWKCDLCGTIYRGPDTNKVSRNRCSKGCDFDICGNCVSPQENQNLEDKIKEEDKKEEDKKEETNETEGNTPECLVCFEIIEKRFVFVPCGHASCCEECSNQVDNCPICREKIQTRLRIYL